MKLKKLTALMILGLGFSVAQAAELPNITILATGGTLLEAVKPQFLLLIKQGNSMLKR